MKNNLYTNQTKHLIAVDSVVFGYKDDELKLLLFHRKVEPQKNKWSLIGGWVEENESVETAANRVLNKLTGISDIYLEQVNIFSKPNRDPGGHVISIVFYALIDIQKHNEQSVLEHGAHWVPLSQLPKLIFDHEDMFKKALKKLQQKASYTVLGTELLSEQFTITQLRSLYNNIFQTEFDPGNFRKKVLSLDVLKKINKKDITGSKKGAYYYTLNHEKNNQLKERIIKI